MKFEELKNIFKVYPTKSTIDSMLDWVYFSCLRHNYFVNKIYMQKKKE